MGDCKVIDGADSRGVAGRAGVLCFGELSPKSQGMFSASRWLHRTDTQISAVEEGSQEGNSARICPTKKSWVPSLTEHTRSRGQLIFVPGARPVSPGVGSVSIRICRNSGLKQS